MKQKIFALLVSVISLSLNAQNFQGKAEYYSKRNLKNVVEEVASKSDSDEEVKTAYDKAIKEASKKMYTLTFNKTEALYEKQESLETPNPNATVSVSLVFSGEGKKYINIQEKVQIIEDDIFGKDFLIVDPLTPLAWKLIDQSKKIGDYTCYKADVIIPVSASEKKEYDDYLKKQQTKPSLIPRDEPKDKKAVAWYAPEIPVSVGPLNYWGLPGLILELWEEDNIILCSKVVLKNNESSKIKVPNKGTKVSQEEFDAIHKAKMDSINGED